MNLFGLGKSKDSKTLPVEGTGKTTISVNTSDKEDRIEVIKDGEIILISAQEFLFKRNHDGKSSNFRLIGTTGSMILSEEELSFIFAEYTKLCK